MLVACLSVAFPALAQPPYLGRLLTEVIEEFRADGWPVVYSTNFVADGMRVSIEPTSRQALGAMREILADLDLDLEAVDETYLIVRAAPRPLSASIHVNIEQSAPSERRRVLVRLRGQRSDTADASGGAVDFFDLPPGEYQVTAESLLYSSAEQIVRVAPGQTAAVTLRLVASVPILEEVTVSASRYNITGDAQYTAAYFSRAEIESLADLGGDPLRIVHRLPGVASTGISAKSHMRGGNSDEMAIVLDGYELFDPFHVRDFQSLFSAVNQRTISSVEVFSGGFPAKYGDSLSGLMLIEPRVSNGPLENEIGVSLLATSLLSAGTMRDETADWLVSVRRGNLDLWFEPDIGSPTYTDAFAHFEFGLGERVRLSINGLASDDDITAIAGSNPVRHEDAHSETRNQQIWLKVETQWSAALAIETVLSSAHFSNTRTGSMADPSELIGELLDRRAMNVDAFKQDWDLEISDRQLLQWGLEFRRLSADYDYRSTASLLGFFSLFQGAPASVNRNLQLSPAGESYSFYLSDRISIGRRVVAEIGLRSDEQTYLRSGDDKQLSPRLSILTRIGPRTDFRASWGRFFQAQDILGLQVEDGITDFFRAQLAEHSIISLEHLFANDLQVRIEAYRKDMPDLQPRYENLFNSFALLPEFQPDRTLIVPSRATATGLEVLLSRDSAALLSWWASYTRANVEESVNGRDVPRSWDQRHSISAGLTWHGENWTLTPSLSYHSGWPTTSLALESAPLGSAGLALAAVPGLRNAARFGQFERIDLRAARKIDLKHGELEFSAEATNLLDRANDCCSDYSLRLDAGGNPLLGRAVDYWLPRVISVGVLWAF